MKVTQKEAELIFDRISAVRERMEQANDALSAIVQSFVDADADEVIQAYSNFIESIDKAVVLADVALDDAETILDKKNP